MPLSTVAGLIAYVDEISVVLGTCSPSAKAPETMASLICSATCRNNGVVPENRIASDASSRLVGSISTSSTLTVGLPRCGNEQPAKHLSRTRHTSCACLEIGEQLPFADRHTPNRSPGKHPDRHGARNTA